MDLVTGPFRTALEPAFRETFARLRRDKPAAEADRIETLERMID